MNRTIGSVLALTLCLSFTGCCGGWGCGRGRGGCSDRVYWGDWYAGAPRCNNNCSFDCEQIDWRGGCNTCGGCNDGCGSCPTASIGSIWSRWVSRYEQPSCECGRADCDTCGPAMEGCDSCTRGGGGGGHHGHHHEMHDGIQGEVIYDGPAENVRHVATVNRLLPRQSSTPLRQRRRTMCDPARRMKPVCGRCATETASIVASVRCGKGKS